MPALKNIWVNPKARLVHDQPRDAGEREAIIEVSGMICEFG